MTDSDAMHREVLAIRVLMAELEECINAIQGGANWHGRVLQVVPRTPWPWAPGVIYGEDEATVLLEHDPYQYMVDEIVGMWDVLKRHPDPTHRPLGRAVKG